MTIQLVNDGIHDTIMSGAALILADLERVKVEAKISIPENDMDQNYKKVLLKTSIDIAKLLNGTRGSFLTQAVMENFHKSIDFEPKFPMKKVKTMNLLAANQFHINDFFRACTRSQISP